MFRLVPTIQTIYSQKEFCKGIIQGWQEQFGTTPSKESVGVVVAQNSIETGGKYFWGNNIGNCKVGNDDPNQVIDYQMLKNVWEIINGKKVMFQPPHRATWFRAFPTLKDGVKFHLMLLKNNRYKVAWPAVEAGDVALFAHLIRQQGYYTAPEKDYIAGMNRFYAPYMKSTDYEQALAEIQSEPQFTHTPVEYSEEIHGDPISRIKTNIQQGIEDAEQVPQAEIERQGSNLATKLQGFMGTVMQWIKPKS